VLADAAASAPRQFQLVKLFTKSGREKVKLHRAVSFSQAQAIAVMDI